VSTTTLLVKGVNPSALIVMTPGVGAIPEIEQFELGDVLGVTVIVHCEPASNVDPQSELAEVSVGQEG
jgi:hypothetical protein